MNPKPVLNYNVVTLQNCDTKPFEIVYDNQSYGIMGAGEIRKMPGFLADHALKHLVDQILNHLEIPTNNIVERNKWAGQCLINEETTVQPVSLSEREKLARDVEQMNQSDMARTMNSRLPENKPDEDGLLPEIDEAALDNLPAETVAAPIIPPVTPAPASTPLQQVTNVPVEPVLPPITPQPAPELVAVDNAKKVPNRQELYDFARNTLKMDLTDKKTMETLENMSVPQVIDELQYYEQTQI